MYPLHGEMRIKDAIARELLGEEHKRTDTTIDDERKRTDVTVDVPPRGEKPSFLADRETDAGSETEYDSENDIDIMTGGAE